MLELLETIISIKPEDEEVTVQLITTRDNYDITRQEEYLTKIQEAVAPAGIHFSWQFADSSAIHARHIITDTGWKIALDRGLDIFQPYDHRDALNLANRLQEYRACRPFEVTYIRMES